MFIRRSLVTVAILATTLALPRAALTEPANEAAIRQVEARWSEAFISGDTAALGALLDPAYVSVSTRGQVRQKAEIIALARAYAAKHPGEHAMPLAANSQVRVMGKSALVLHRSPNEVSVDVFYHDGQNWRAWYSQHTATPAEAVSRPSR